MSTTTRELRGQWGSPGDITSLLLLIGGDIVQKAIAQLIGYKLRIPGQSLRSSGISIAPVAFSFGWVAYGFSILLSAIGEMRLMPDSDVPLMVVNCQNGFTRENRSWALGRLFRDYRSKHEVDSRPIEKGGRAESIRIDVFNLGPGPASGPTCDFVWRLGWVVILTQIAIAVIPWVRYGDWGVMLVALGGNLLAATTCAMPQWTEEKWAARELERDKITCLTRGNGSLHIMVIIGTAGSWDLEHLATGTSIPRPETRLVASALAVLWCCLLITVSGLKEHSWFLVAIGGIGMIQNVVAAGAFRNPSTSNLHITTFRRAPTIIGVRGSYKDDTDTSVDLKGDLEQLSRISTWVLSKPAAAEQQGIGECTPSPGLDSRSKEEGFPEWLEPIQSRDSIIQAAGVHGALIELEKWIPTAGLAMVQIFFPVGLQYTDESIRDNIHKKFWKRAYHTKSIRTKGEEKRRAAARIACPEA